MMFQAGRQASFGEKKTKHKKPKNWWKVHLALPARADAQGRRVTSQGTLCASGNPLLKDMHISEKVKHPYLCCKGG